MRIGIIREGKVPVDKRVAVTPQNAGVITSRYPSHSVVCQPSSIRCFSDKEYEEAGILIDEDMSTADILIGVKEVPLDWLIPDKTYLFFSHTIKKQPYNRKLLQEILKKGIRLIDYEKLYDGNGNRVVAFGRFAGIVGAYNAIWTYGKRYNLFHLRRASECHDIPDLQSEYPKVKLPSVKIALTGGGRVSKGAMEVLMGMGIRKVSPADFIKKYFDGPVFTQLGNADYNRRIDGKPYSRSDFFVNPKEYEGTFMKYARSADILIAGAYWDPSAPVLFTREQMMKPGFSIKVIADITCDIDGSIPSTIRPSTIAEPVYDYNPSDHKELPAFSDEENVTVMAVDNLPCELPRDASVAFSNDLLEHTLPRLLGETQDEIAMIERATIAKNGKLTSHYTYLQNYVDGKE